MNLPLYTRIQLSAPWPPPRPRAAPAHKACGASTQTASHTAKHRLCGRSTAHSTILQSCNAPKTAKRTFPSASSSRPAPPCAPPLPCSPCSRAASPRSRPAAPRPTAPGPRSGAELKRVAPPLRSHLFSDCFTFPSHAISGRQPPSITSPPPSSRIPTAPRGKRFPLAAHAPAPLLIPGPRPYTRRARGRHITLGYCAAMFGPRRPSPLPRHPLVPAPQRTLRRCYRPACIDGWPAATRRDLAAT